MGQCGRIDESTAEKPSYLLFGRDCRFPVEAALLPATEIEVTDYRRELTQLLADARRMTMHICSPSSKLRGSTSISTTGWTSVWKGNTVLAIIPFPQEESGKLKLLIPWHGSYQVVEVTATGISAVRVYSRDQKRIHVHLHWVTRCPPNFPAGPQKWTRETRFQVSSRKWWS